MPYYERFIKKEYKGNLTAIRDDIANRRNKNFFWPNGTQVYAGRQGSGKTISAVHHTFTLKNRYPLAVLVSNLQLKGMESLSFNDEATLSSLLASMNPQTQYILFKNLDQLSLALVGVNNDFYGVIYLIDEIHLYFNSLDSKNVPMFVFTEISQQRKQRKLIIGTSQIFTRLSKPFREQCDSVIMCRNIGYLTVQTAYDGDVEEDFNGKLVGTKKRIGFFWQTRDKRERFDTYQKVISASEQYDSTTTIILDSKKAYRR